jgi:uncharacterized protein (TIGR02246 family)
MSPPIRHDEQAIRNLIQEWHRATNAGEVERILPLMAEDVVFLTPGNAPIRGRATFEEGLRTLLQGHRVESRGDIQELQVSGDLAYCWNKIDVRILPLSGGEGMARSGFALTLFRKQGGNWQLFRDANLLPPPK